MDPKSPTMVPAPGARLQRFLGDCLSFELRIPGNAPRRNWRAMLRTNLGRAEVLRCEILKAHTHGLPPAGESWRDIPMLRTQTGWRLELPLAEIGFFKAKAYLVDERGWQHWPEGPDVGVSVHPDRHRTANIIYCAFPRLFGASKSAVTARDDRLEASLRHLDNGGFAVVPPSGKLRDLERELPHIFQRLGCRILHLLPVNPTPTTFARFGRFGSPYASLDLRAVDPALVVFDKRTTGIQQFQELTYSTHLLGGRVFLDIVINHTGWGSVLQENHPEWFLRDTQGNFVSPGAWGTIWEDLVELKNRNVEIWDELADTFLTWCRRGVDGFRCDAGYMVPVSAWQYIISRVQQEYPETVFLLEGLGGAWDATEALLTEGGMQWAYSEMFQNYSAAEVANYSDHAVNKSACVGLLVHYSETHDNDRLARKGRGWSLLRNRLAGLISVSGGFGFTCGVEWLAVEKIRVHGCTGLSWDSKENMLPELAALNRLLAEHPCFFEGAIVTRLSPSSEPVQMWLRESAEGSDLVLVVVNTDVDHPRLTVQERPQRLPVDLFKSFATGTDLLGQSVPRYQGDALEIPPAGVYCLALEERPVGIGGDDYRRMRAHAAWGLRAITRVLPVEQVGSFNWRQLSAMVDRSPKDFLASVSRLPLEKSATSVMERLEQTAARPGWPNVITWTLRDQRRVTLVPPDHWLLVTDGVPFRASLEISGSELVHNEESILVAGGHVICFPPRHSWARGTLRVERYGAGDRHVEASILFLSREPAASRAAPKPADVVLLTNGRGGMARICVDLGRVLSKYDCVLGANLHPSLPVDRHVFAKRVRVWVNADGFISPLDLRNLAAFEAGPPAVWHFVANAGDGRSVQIRMTAEMPAECNSTVFRFARPSAEDASGKQLPAEADVRLTVRIDLEDRNFHWETRRNGGAEHHFSTHTRVLQRGDTPVVVASGDSAKDPVGFAFKPAPDRFLRVFVDSGSYYSQPEWSENIPHPLEQSRGQTGTGDAWSPGWFDLPLAKGGLAQLVVTAEDYELESSVLEANKAEAALDAAASQRESSENAFGAALERSARAFVVRRGVGKTVIAGYPWFLDWGRDTFICARGLLAAGMFEEIQQILETFAQFEENGTLPNTVFGEDASNRETSDAPLWFGVVCEELAAWEKARGKDQFSMLRRPSPHASGRSLLQVVESIASHYVRGVPNGVRMDPGSALIWSPAHFTWMDTNYPAGTPREGYPVEIQALWIRVLEFLASESAPKQKAKWSALARQARDSVEHFFWLEEQGYYSDVLLASAGLPAAKATPDDALRSNCLFLISLGLGQGERARRCVLAARDHLVVPGALRSLAPLPVKVPAPVRDKEGRFLNNPLEPYWGRYEGDEDTGRKPAYHNGTAWTWTFPVFCEALVRAWEFSPAAMAAATAYLGSAATLMWDGCLGHLPEIVDGDAPHLQRGCDAQAWGATEALRVWTLLARSELRSEPSTEV